VLRRPRLLKRFGKSGLLRRLGFTEVNKEGENVQKHKLKGAKPHVRLGLFKLMKKNINDE
jgi:hypothetical protein